MERKCFYNLLIYTLILIISLPACKDPGADDLFNPDSGVVDNPSDPNNDSPDDDDSSQDGGSGGQPRSASHEFDFFAGTFNQVLVNLDDLELDGDGIAAGTGSFTSGIFDATFSGAISNLQFDVDSPAGLNMPNNQSVESEFSSGNLDMSSNVLLLHLDEANLNGSAGEVIDSSGLGHHGVQTASGAEASSGQLGGGVSFDGLGGHIQVPDHADLDFTNALTLSGWFFFNGDIGNKRLLVKGLQDNSTWAYRFVTLDNGAFGFQDGILVQLSANGSSVLVQTFLNNGLQNLKDQWVHIAATYDGSTLKLYLNGVEVSSASQSGTVFNSSGALAIGAATDGDFAMDGAADEIALFNQALSADSILAMYHRGAHRLSVQVRACELADCSDGTFVGSDASSSSSFSPAAASNDFNLSGLGIAGRYFQIKTTLSSEDSSSVKFSSPSLSVSE